jgi:hypothetical protein
VGEERDRAAADALSAEVMARNAAARVLMAASAIIPDHAIKTALGKETEARQAAVSTLGLAIDDQLTSEQVQNAITDEVAARNSAINALPSSQPTEWTNIIATALTLEAGARRAAIEAVKSASMNPTSDSADIQRAMGTESAARERTLHAAVQIATTERNRAATSPSGAERLVQEADTAPLTRTNPPPNEDSAPPQEKDSGSGIARRSVR